MCLVRGCDGVGERMRARDVRAVGDDDDCPSRAVVLRQPLGGEDDGVVQRRPGFGIDGEVGDLVARLGRGRSEPRQRDGRTSEHDDSDVIVGAGARSELLDRRDRIFQGTSTHRLRAVDGDDDALRLAQVDGLRGRDRLSVLTQHRCRRADGSDVRDAQRREGTRVDRLDPGSSSCGRRGEENRKNGEADERPPHSKPPPKPVAAKDARTWSESSAAKNEGGRTTLLAAIFSRKWGLRPVARSGESSR